MKIILPKSNRGGLPVLLAMLVAVVVIVGVAGCVIGKVLEKGRAFQEKRDHDLTNEIEGFVAEYIRETGDTNAKVAFAIRTNYYRADERILYVLQCSTDLSTWTDLEAPAEALTDVVTSTARLSNGPPFMFFRVKP